MIDTTGLGPALEEVNNIEVPIHDRKALDNLLYSTEKLRKRGDEDGIEAE